MKRASAQSLASCEAGHQGSQGHPSIDLAASYVRAHYELCNGVSTVHRVKLTSTIHGIDGHHISTMEVVRFGFSVGVGSSEAQAPYFDHCGVEPEGHSGAGVGVTFIPLQSDQNPQTNRTIAIRRLDKI